MSYVCTSRSKMIYEKIFEYPAGRFRGVILLFDHLYACPMIVRVSIVHEFRVRLSTVPRWISLSGGRCFARTFLSRSPVPTPDRHETWELGRVARRKPAERADECRGDVNVKLKKKTQTPTTVCSTTRTSCTKFVYTVSTGTVEAFEDVDSIFKTSLRNGQSNVPWTFNSERFSKKRFRPKISSDERLNSKSNPNTSQVKFCAPDAQSTV